VQQFTKLAMKPLEKITTSGVGEMVDKLKELYK